MKTSKKIASIIFAGFAFAQCSYTITPDQISELGLLNAINIQNNPELDPTLPTVTSTLLDGGRIESGFLAGTASPPVTSQSPVTSVEVAVDGGSFVTATGTTNWTYQLPAGASTWRRGTQHTIQVRATAENGNVSAVTNLTVRMGRNRDVNGDGYPDLAVGANLYTSSTGRAYVFHSQGAAGISSGSAAGANTILTGDATGDEFGYALALGDVNGDGYADLMVGARTVNTNEGRVYIFLSAGGTGIAGGTATAQAATVLNPTGAVGGTDTLMGTALDLADINGDGYDDAVIGFPNEQSNLGRARIYHSAGSGGIASGPVGGAATLLNMTGPPNSMGVSLSTGDVNGDGFQDVLVGERNGNGRAVLWLSPGSGGITSGDETTAQAIITGEAGGVLAEANSLHLGDVNGDGFADLMASAPGFNTGIGRAYIFYSPGSSGITGTQSAAAAGTIMDGQGATDGLGDAMASGDANGDGFADFAISAVPTPFASDVHLFTSQGSAGIAGGTVPATPTLTANVTNNSLGASLSMKDLNGDGYADLIAGADIDSVNGPRVYIMNGGSAGIANQDLSAGGTVTAIITGEGTLDGFGVAIAR